jgi:hypothetical protein
MRPQADLKTELPIPAHPDTLWEVEVKTAAPVRNTPETPLSAAVEATAHERNFGLEEAGCVIHNGVCLLPHCR